MALRAGKAELQAIAMSIATVLRAHLPADVAAERAANITQALGGCHSEQRAWDAITDALCSDRALHYNARLPWKTCVAVCIRITHELQSQGYQWPLRTGMRA